MIKIMNMTYRKREFLLLIFLFATIVFSIVILGTNKQQKTYRSKANENITPAPEASPSAKLALLEIETEGYNSTLLSLLNEYTQGDEAKKQALLPQLMQNVKERKKKMLEMLQINPQSVYNKALSKDTLSQFPTETQHILEKRIDTLQGTVNTFIYDDFEHHISHETATFIPDTNENEEINFYPTDRQTFLSGTKVVLNNSIRIDEDNNQVLGVSSVYGQESTQKEETTIASHIISSDIHTVDILPLDTLGEQKVLVFLAKTKDVDESQFPTPQEIEEKINGQIKNFYNDNSYGKMTLQADVVKKWYKLDKSSKDFVFSTYKNGIHKIADSLQKKLIKYNPSYKRYALFIGSNDLSGTNWGAGSIGFGSFLYNQRNEAIFNLSDLFLILTPNSFNTGRLNTINENYSPFGQMNRFNELFIHEFGHNLGAHHASSVICSLKNRIPAGLIPRYSSDQKNILEFSNMDCDFDEYGNQFDAMGSSIRDAYFNGFIKQSFQWIDPNANDRLTVINPRFLDDKRKKQKFTHISIPIGSTSLLIQPDKGLNDFSYFLEYRKEYTDQEPKQQGLAIVIPEQNIFPYKGQFRDNSAKHTFLFEQSDENQLFPIGSCFIDEINNIKITPESIDEVENTLTFKITPFNKEDSLNKIEKFVSLISLHAGNGDVSSLNIFENDIKDGQRSIPRNIRFIALSKKTCMDNPYFLKEENIAIVSGNTNIKIIRVREPKFSIEDYQAYENDGIDITISLNENAQNLPNSRLSFFINDFNTVPTYQSVYDINLVPSVNEYKNDLEPINLYVTSIEKIEGQLRIKKDEDALIHFISTIGNNSRNPDGNKSSDFIIKWYIEDEKGNDVIPPVTQSHEGIPPKSTDIDYANPARLTWTIPQELKAGDYKIILEVDWNDRLQEFNENNNMIWRYFSLVE